MLNVTKEEGGSESVSVTARLASARARDRRPSAILRSSERHFEASRAGDTRPAHLK